jgi:protein SCO1/2
MAGFRSAVMAFALGLTIASPLARAAAPPPPAPLISGDFDLQTLKDRPVTLASYRGKWVLLYFGYTSCPDTCPTVLNELGNALTELGPKAQRVQALFITVDPARDKKPVMIKYMKEFDPRIEGLLGDPDSIEAAAKSFHVYYRARAIGHGEYAIDHSSYLYVIDPKGHFVELLGADVPGHKLALEIRRLIR